MALYIKDESVHEKVKRIAAITGQTQAQAVGTAVAEMLNKLEQDSSASRLLAEGAKIANLLPEEVRHDDHAEMLYDKNGMPG
ncbi:type II toxin-antitoxin system VapB family antitoxin [Rhodococcus erythropolis]|uniref:type II toxin-antitoxin system VapB family antitoxin n=1 Tax=Rhodococcus erythropolis TaxID=1833 RepID=UPI0018A2676D|nr:type II toxin-antitoxin system VapB family antitoxin [Rhodococcus erythropolis]MBF7736703.1 type II toxin-antitoxin system VapB family antitoxin [Rhodococcus erythropolis]MCZ4644056.1 type II toxin-antitoxin system VapB family antitoxin [Rhodococcus erythropolis]